MITLYENNESCIKMLQHEKIRNKTKHIDSRFHPIKQLREDGIVELKYYRTKHMVADELTDIPKSELVKHRIYMKLLANPNEGIKGGC